MLAARLLFHLHSRLIVGSPFARSLLGAGEGGWSWTVKARPVLDADFGVMVRTLREGNHVKENNNNLEFVLIKHLGGEGVQFRNRKPHAIVTDTNHVSVFTANATGCVIFFFFHSGFTEEHSARTRSGTAHTTAERVMASIPTAPAYRFAGRDIQIYS